MEFRSRESDYTVFHWLCDIVPQTTGGLVEQSGTGGTGLCLIVTFQARSMSPIVTLANDMVRQAELTDRNHAGHVLFLSS